MTCDIRRAAETNDRIRWRALRMARAELQIARSGFFVRGGYGNNLLGYYRDMADSALANVLHHRRRLGGSESAVDRSASVAQDAAPER